MKGYYKKATFEDRFVRNYYCKGASLRYVRYTKRYNNRIFRKMLKNEQEKILRKEQEKP